MTPLELKKQVAEGYNECKRLLIGWVEFIRRDYVRAKSVIAWAQGTNVLLMRVGVRAIRRVCPSRSAAPTNLHSQDLIAV